MCVAFIKTARQFLLMEQKLYHWILVGAHVQFSGSSRMDLRDANLTCLSYPTLLPMKKEERVGKTT